MAFNIVARNQDDHVKNIAFLMDKHGYWQLAPAFDVTYSYNLKGLWTAQHQMSMNGKRDHFVRQDFRECAKLALLKRGQADAILDEVILSVSTWEEIANRLNIPDAWVIKIKQAHRLLF
jgi:serine/threonine-protein kinase HipA